MVTSGKSGLIEKQVFRAYTASMARTWTYRLAGWFQRRFLRWRAGGDGFVHKAPGPMRGWTDVRDLPAPAPRSFRKWWKRHHR
jgi:L-lactate dehydrogenase complex protein LldF